MGGLVLGPSGQDPHLNGRFRYRYVDMAATYHLTASLSSPGAHCCGGNRESFQSR
jgi:hypothetical protein